MEKVELGELSDLFCAESFLTKLLNGIPSRTEILRLMLNRLCAELFWPKTFRSKRSLAFGERFLGLLVGFWQKTFAVEEIVNFKKADQKIPS